MFDITKFLNSKAVAEYWKKIGFDERCTPQQAAFVIWTLHPAAGGVCNMEQSQGRAERKNRGVGMAYR